MESSSTKKESTQKLKGIIREETKEENRINESRTNHAAPITERESKKLYNSIVGINIALSEKESISGTGFFIKLNIKNKIRYFLMTCHHVIQERFVNAKKVINFYYG